MTLNGEKNLVSGLVSQKKDTKGDNAERTILPSK
jgi:hypothetical protein